MSGLRTGSLESCLLLARLLPDCEPLDKSFPSLAQMSTPCSNSVTRFPQEGRRAGHDPLVCSHHLGRGL